MSRILPSGYRQLEYIQSSGTQYIDTGFIPTSDNLEISYKSQVIRTGDNMIYGIDNIIGSNALNINEYGSEYLYTRLRGAQVVPQTTLTDVHAIKIANNIVYIDGVESTSISGFTLSLATNTSPLRVLGRTGTTSYLYQGKIYSFGYKEDNVAKLNLIPAKRTSDSAIGMYDLVSKQFFTNSGSGTFTAGPVIDLPESGYKELQYIQSTSSGGQYIDTGLPYTAGYDYEVNCMFTTTQYNGTVFGTRTSACRIWFLLYGGVFEVGMGSDWKTSTAAIDTLYNHKLETTLDSGGTTVSWTATLNGTVEKTGTQSTSDLPTSNIWLFDNSTVSGSHYPARGLKIYSFKTWNADGVLVRNMIPVKQVSDSAIGMYDTVNDVFYANAGTGAFIAGPTVEVEYSCYQKKISHTVLPSGYTELEYIESSGTQYIDTGIVYQGTSDKIKLVIAPLMSNVDKAFYGCYGNPSGVCEIGQIDDIFRGNVSSINAPTVTIGQKYTMINENGQWSTDGVLFGIVSQDSITDHSNIIFGRWYNTVDKLNTLRLYSHIYTRDSIVIQNLIPARDSSNVVGMYDTVSQTFFTNSGSGTFTAGPEVGTYTCYKAQLTIESPRLPSDYQEIEYIQTTGTQYIDTRVAPTLTQVFKTKFNAPETTGDTLFGQGGETLRFFNYASKVYWQIIRSNRIIGPDNSCVINTDYEFEFGNNYVKDIPTQTTIVTGTEATSLPSSDSIKLSYYSSTSFTKCIWYYFQIYDNDSTVLNLVPAKRISDSVLGMYDINNSGKNLYDLKVLDGTLSQTDGVTVSSSSGNAVSDYIDTSANKTFIISNAASGKNVRVFKYGTNKAFIDASTLVTTGTAFTLEESVKYIRVQFNYTSSSLGTQYLQIEAGSEATSYEPFPFYQNAGTGTFTAGSDVNPTTTYTIYKRMITA